MANGKLQVKGIPAVKLENNSKTYATGTSITFNLHTTAEATLGSPRFDVLSPTGLFGTNGSQVEQILDYPVAT